MDAHEILLQSVAANHPLFPQAKIILGALYRAAKHVLLKKDGNPSERDVSTTSEHDTAAVAIHTPSGIFLRLQKDGDQPVRMQCGCLWTSDAVRDGRTTSMQATKMW